MRRCHMCRLAFSLQRGNTPRASTGPAPSRTARFGSPPSAACPATDAPSWQVMAPTSSSRHTTPPRRALPRRHSSPAVRRFPVAIYQAGLWSSLPAQDLSVGSLAPSQPPSNPRHPFGCHYPDGTSFGTIHLVGVLDAPSTPSQSHRKRALPPANSSCDSLPAFSPSQRLPRAFSAWDVACKQSHKASHVKLRHSRFSPTAGPQHTHPFRPAPHHPCRATI
jgi:hypothetical protein